MTPDDVLARHQQDRFGHCSRCGTWLQDEQDYVPEAWPCDAIREADRAEAAEAKLTGCIDRYDRTIAAAADLHLRAVGYAQEAASAAEADAERLATALRDAIDIAHETDSLRSHSDNERKDGWFRAPLYRCTDATCEEATAALAAHEARVSEEATR